MICRNNQKLSGVVDQSTDQSDVQNILAFNKSFSIRSMLKFIYHAKMSIDTTKRINGNVNCRAKKEELIYFTTFVYFVDSFYKIPVLYKLE